MSSDEAAPLCLWCNQPTGTDAIVWWRVWNDDSGRKQIEGYTHPGRCHELVTRRYWLTDEELAEYVSYHPQATREEPER